MGKKFSDHDNTSGLKKIIIKILDATEGCLLKVGFVLLGIIGITKLIAWLFL